MNNPIKQVAARFARRVALEVVRAQAAEQRSDEVSAVTWEAALHQYWQDSGVRYSALASLATRHGYVGASLSAAELRVFSQNGEDGVLAEIFAQIGVGDRFFVEFGVEDGVECNSRFLAEVRGWSGVYFEADSGAYESLATRLANRQDIQTVHAPVTPENVNELFGAAGVPRSFDLLSIDIDGQDYWVWEALRGFEPRVVVVEYNAGLPATERLVEEKGRTKWQKTDYFGASLGALVALGSDKGYRLVHTELAGVNAFFIRNDLARDLAWEPLNRGLNYDLRGRRHTPHGGDTGYVEV
jgi:hypothetical protein